MHSASPGSPASLTFHVPPRAVRWRWWLLSLMLVGLAIGYWVAARLPASVGWENGWLENLQVVVLLGGAAMAIAVARQGTASADWGRTALKGLAVAVVPLWCLMAARELSWGAAFLPPIGFDEDGPAYSSAMLWYKPAVAPLALLVVAWCGWMAGRSGALRVVLRLLRSPKFVWAELAVMVLAGVLSTYAEGHLGFPAPVSLGHHAVVMEEWSEMFAYVALVMAQWQMFVLLRNARRAPAAGNR